MSDASILAEYPVFQYIAAAGIAAAAIYGAWRGEIGARRARAVAQHVPDETMVYWGGPNTKMLELLQNIDRTLTAQREDNVRTARDQKDAQERQTDILREVRERLDRR